MKKIYILFTFLIIFSSCNCRSQDKCKNIPLKKDTIFVQNFDTIQKLNNQIQFWKLKYDSLNNNILYENYMNSRKIEKIKYYITICNKNSKNKKFFFGWVKRTIVNQ